MSDQQAATEQPVDSPAEGTDTTPQVPDGYIPEKDYKEVQAWATRDAQKAAELERQQQDPEYQAQVAKQWLEANGYTLPEDTDDEFADSQQELDPRIAARLAKVDELEQRWDSMTAKEQREEHYSTYRETFDPELTKLGVPETFLESVADIAYNELDAIQTPQGPKPDLDGAVARFKELQALVAALPEVQQQAVEAWRKGKRTAPHVSPTGREGTRAPKLETPEDMTDAVLEYMADNA